MQLGRVNLGRKVCLALGALALLAGTVAGCAGSQSGPGVSSVAPTTPSQVANTETAPTRAIAPTEPPTAEAPSSPPPSPGSPTPTDLPANSQPATASTTFSPGSVQLAAIGDSVTITVEAVGTDPAANGVQLNLQHPESLAITASSCVGLFEGGTLIPATETPGGTMLGCFFLSGAVRAPSGPVMTFELTRSATVSGDQTISFGLEGATATQFSRSGTSVSAGRTNQLTVRP